MSLERSGFKTRDAKRIPEFKAGESKKFYYDIFPKQALDHGDQAIRLTVTEHYKGFNYVKRKNEKVLKLAIED